MLSRRGTTKIGYVLRFSTDYKNFTAFQPLTIPIHVYLSEEPVAENFRLFDNQDVWHMLPSEIIEERRQENPENDEVLEKKEQEIRFEPDYNLKHRILMMTKKQP